VQLKTVSKEETVDVDETATTATATQARRRCFGHSTAAELAGFSIRHFRRIIEEDRIPIVQIGPEIFHSGRIFHWNPARDKGRRRRVTMW